MLLRLRPTKINFYLRFMEECGFSSQQVLSGTGLTPSALQSPYFLVDVATYIRIVFNLKKLYKKPSLAFDLGKNLSLGDLGILGYAMQSSATTAHTNAIWHQYNSLFFGNFIDVRFEETDGKTRAIYTPNIDAEIRPELIRYFMEERINIDVAVFRIYGLGDYPVESWSVTYSPGNAKIIKLYEALINAPIHFAAKENSFTLKSSAHETPLPGRDPETHQHCMQLIERIYHNLNNYKKISALVKSIFIKELGNNLSIDNVAARINTSKRTLSRKLAEEGLTFSDVFSETRTEAIINYLLSTNLTHDDIAEKVGFSNASSLRRFFKLQTGKTMSDYRNEIE